MFKLRSSLFSLLTLCGVAFSINAQADNNMNMPKPLDNKVYDSMVGTWKGDSNMMDMKMHDVMKIHWALNHQFLILDLKSTSLSKPTMTYEGMGVFGVDAQGKAKTWWFDSWGANEMSTGAGDFSDNKLTITDSNSEFSETRSFTIDGKTMVMHAQGTVTKPGKTISFDNSTTYKK